MRSNLAIGLFLFFSITLITAVFYSYQVLFTPNITIDQDSVSASRKEISIYIPTGADFETVMDTLVKKKLLQDIISFRFLAKLLNYTDNVKPGRYLIKDQWSNLKTIRTLRAGMQTPVKLTFNNIRLKGELAEKLAKYVQPTLSEIEQILSDRETAERYGFDTNTFMSMFIPNTYEVYWTITVEGLIEKMYNEYNAFWSEDKKRQADVLKMTPVEVAILASIVEAETQMTDERLRVAGVYINRLRKNMRLQADPTVVFALGDFSIKRVLARHKKINSPYNTYKYRGLPPGPINLPTISSIEAVLNYEKHDYLYFCAKEDFSGYHNFAQTIEQHLNNARLYQKALSNEIRKGKDSQQAVDNRQ
ncbi:MAG: endolytic transglycosylase MltG [Cytophagales bacterium]|nr:endolytic transglycosylase MltG [Cytophagales bacterium]